MESIVSARGLGVRTRRGWVFRDVDLDIAAGDLVAITGPEGSGRTSLLLALAGRFRTTHGTLTRHGRAGLGHIPGVTDPEPHLTAAEHVEERRILTRRRTKSEVLKVYGVSPAKRGRDMTALDRHLLGLALARVDEPDLVVVDEVGPGLSTVESDELWAHLKDLASSGVAVVVACREAPAFATVIALENPA
jgi:ABC-2 type transport system ATP-binding protein